MPRGPADRGTAKISAGRKTDVTGRPAPGRAGRPAAPTLPTLRALPTGGTLISWVARPDELQVRCEGNMALSGWKKLLAGAPWFRGEGRFPIAAYSEFMPPPRAGLKPYGADGPPPFADADPWGWPVTEA